MYLISDLLFYKVRGVLENVSHVCDVTFWEKLEDGFQLLKHLRPYHTALEKSNIFKIPQYISLKRQVFLQSKNNNLIIILGYV